MAEHRARHHGSASGTVRAADLLARLDSGSRSSGHRRRAPQPGFLLPALAMPGGSPAGLTLPALALPRLPSLPSLPSAQTGRTLIAAMSTGAIGVTAAIIATAGPTAAAPEQPTDVAPTGLELAANPAAAPAAAAAFSLPQARTAEPAPATGAPVTGAELAAAAVPSASAIPAPSVSASAPASDAATASADATPSPVTLVPEADATEKARDAAEKAAAAAAKADAAAKKAPKADSEPKVAAASSAGAKAVAFAKGEIGTPYRYGATGPSAYDCSGLVMAAFKKAGVDLPRTSAAQSRVGTAVSRNELKPGDLVFFYSPVSHVGIYLGGGKMVHASTSGEPVKISDIGRRPFHNARRV